MLCQFFCCSLLYGQSYTISGYITEAGSGESLIGAAIYDSLSGRGCYSNEYGYYSLSLPAGEVLLRAQYAAHEPFRKAYHLVADTSLDIALALHTLDIVEITDDVQHDLRSNGIGRIRISLPQLNAVPALLGEKDVLKALALTPGVSTGIEGTSGLLVRGGSPDQNLLLLDGATVYNAAHLFGFVSIFNSEALKHVELYKGDFPARFGGRLSSVVDIRMKEGNNQKRQGKASIGLLSSKLLLEGPIQKGRTSYMVSARASYLGIFLLPTYISYKRGKTTNFLNYWLYDVNAKMNHTFKDKSRLFISAYTGHDAWQAREGNRQLESRFNLNWGNTTTSLRYYRSMGTKWFMESMLTFSRYHYGLGTLEQGEIANGGSSLKIDNHSELESRIKDWTGKWALDYHPTHGHHFKMGLEATAHRYDPAIGTSNVSSRPVSPNEAIFSREYAAYLEDNIRLTPWWSIYAGGRATVFEVEDTIYSSLEPRFSMSWGTAGNWAIKAAYSQMQQYLHLLSNHGVGLPNDIWVPATAKVAPQQARQWSLGFSKNISAWHTELTIDAYYKRMAKLIDYRPGTDFLSVFDQSWQDIVEKNGKGEVYGLEVMLHKKQGRLNGWLAYTLSWNRRKFARINGGHWYAAKYDRRHEFSFTASYQLTEKWRLASTWVYSSGQPVTLPIGIQQDLNGQEVFIYAGRNNMRMPAYHRLDVGAEYHFTTSNGRKAQLSLGVYNLYNRKNPFYLDIERASKVIYGPPVQELNTPERQMVLKSLFPFLPSITYSWTF